MDIEVYENGVNVMSENKQVTTETTVVNEEHQGIMHGYELSDEEFLIIQCYRKSNELTKDVIKKIIGYDALLEENMDANK